MQVRDDTWLDFTGSHGGSLMFQDSQTRHVLHNKQGLQLVTKLEIVPGCLAWTVCLCIMLLEHFQFTPHTSPTARQSLAEWM